MGCDKWGKWGGAVRLTQMERHLRPPALPTVNLLNRARSMALRGGIKGGGLEGGGEEEEGEG